jgi:hypothetical protein
MNCRTGSDRPTAPRRACAACTETAGRTLRTRIAFKPAPNGTLPTNTTRRRNAVRFASNLTIKLIPKRKKLDRKTSV